MGSDLYINPPDPPDPIEQIRRRLEWQKQEIEKLQKLVVEKDAEIRRLENIVLERTTVQASPRPGSAYDLPALAKARGL